MTNQYHDSMRDEIKFMVDRLDFEATKTLHRMVTELDEAHGDRTLVWGEQENEQAISEGWNLFINAGRVYIGRTSLCLQSDESAVELVAEKAKTGSKLHIAASKAHGTLSSSWDWTY